MGEIVKLEASPGVARSVAYEYSPEKSVFKLDGNVAEIFALKTSETTLTKEKFLQLLHKNDRKNYINSIERTIATGAPLKVTYQIILPDKRILNVTDIASLSKKDGVKNLIGILYLSESRHERDLHSYLDTTAVFEQLRKSLEHTVRNNQLGCFLKIRINNLSTILCWHGEERAREILEDIKENLEKFAGQSSFVFRIAIDKFGVIIENTSKEEIHQAVNKIHYFVKQFRGKEANEPLRLNVSIGSVYFPEWAKTDNEVLSKAFVALSSATESHNNFYSDYSDAEKEQQFSKDQIQIMHYMKDAVNQDRFRLAYQPIVESKTGKVASYECLLRQRNNDGQISTAWPVIHVAEKTGFIDMVDHFVLESVVNELKTYKDLHLTFNVSNMTTDSPKWLSSCTKYLSDADIASRITVEITETAAERDLKQTAYFVASLQALGCKVALDDFGAGYTSFRQLKSLSVDMVKIDGMFILDLAENSENLLFIKTLLDFNGCYGLQTIAECVESGEVAKILMDMNVDYMQGYYFGVPSTDPVWHKTNPGI